MHRLIDLLRLKRLYLYKTLGYRYTDNVTVSQTLKPSKATFENTLRSPDALKTALSSCHLCTLAKTRKNVVIPQGPLDASLMFVASYPGTLENENGLPFQGRSGEMLHKMIRNVLQLDPNRCYFTYVVKCKPDDANRFSDAASACLPYLLREIELVAPKLVVSLGDIPYRLLTNEEKSFDAIRGLFTPYRDTHLTATFSPAYLLRNPGRKKETYDDLLRIKAFLTR